MLRGFTFRGSLMLSTYHVFLFGLVSVSVEYDLI